MSTGGAAEIDRHETAFPSVIPCHPELIQHLNGILKGSDGHRNYEIEFACASQPQKPGVLDFVIVSSHVADYGDETLESVTIATSPDVPEIRHLDVILLSPREFRRAIARPWTVAAKTLARIRNQGFDVLAGESSPYACMMKTGSLPDSILSLLVNRPNGRNASAGNGLLNQLNEPPVPITDRGASEFINSIVRIHHEDPDYQVEFACSYRDAREDCTEVIEVSRLMMDAGDASFDYILFPVPSEVEGLRNLRFRPVSPDEFYRALGQPDSPGGALLRQLIERQDFEVILGSGTEFEKVLRARHTA